MGRTKRKIKDECRGEIGMGYYPFSALGSDIAGGVTTWAAGCEQGERACVHDWAATRVAAHAYDKGARCARPGPSRNDVVTHFLGSRPTVGVSTRRLQGEPFWCRDTLFGVET